MSGQGLSILLILFLIPETVTCRRRWEKFHLGVDFPASDPMIWRMGITVTLPWHLVDHYIQEWEQRAIALHAEAEELEAAAAAARAQSKGTYPPKSTTPAPVPVPLPALPKSDKLVKAPKGENQRRIVEWLRSAGPAGAPIAAICKGSGVGQSSVDLVLKRGDGTIFRKDGTTKMWSLIKL